jgi:hypothetical protein
VSASSGEVCAHLSTDSAAAAAREWAGAQVGCDERCAFALRRSLYTSVLQAVVRDGLFCQGRVVCDGWHSIGLL